MKKEVPKYTRKEILESLLLIIRIVRGLMIS